MSEKIKLPRRWPNLFSHAHFSDSRTHRYQLWRSWPERRYDDRNWVAFIGLNPSTADEHTDDRTVAGCIRRAIRWRKFVGMWMLNLFAFRGTDPRTMLAADDPTGDPHCLDAIRDVVTAPIVTRVVLCWGEHGAHRNRAAKVLEMLEASEAVRPKLCYLELNKSGQPKHPLYVAGSVEPKPWIGRNRIEVSV